MTTPRYMRPGIPSWLWGIIIACALALALWLAGRQTVAAIREDERAKVLAEGQSLVGAALAIQRAQWARERDSLRALVHRADTVLVTRLRHVRDTAWLPADTAAPVRLRACMAQLDSLAAECAAFRVTATAALALADSAQRRDSAVIAGLSLQLAATQRADSLARAALAQRPTWGRVAGGVVLGFTLGILGGLLR